MRLRGTFPCYRPCLAFWQCCSVRRPSGPDFMTGKAKSSWITQTYAVVLVLIAVKLVWEVVGQF